MVESVQKKYSVLAVLSLILGCFFVIPFLGPLFSIPALILGIIALVIISKEEKNLRGKGLAISGIVLGALGMIIIPFATLLSTIVMPNLLRARVSVSEADAKATVMTISTAIETYAAANRGYYPVSEFALIDGDAPYSAKSYDNQLINGYRYILRLNPNSYSVVASPETCGITGTKIIVAKTGGLIQEKECKYNYND